MQRRWFIGLLLGALSCGGSAGPRNGDPAAAGAGARGPTTDGTGAPAGNPRTAPAPTTDRGRLLGSFVHTFYWMEFESDYPGEADTELELASCTPLGHVPAAFAERVCVEGSGRLADGRLLNLSGACACGHLCRETGARVCFFAEEGAAAPWGYGSDGNPLVPLRSLAVDEAVIPHGGLVYIPEWDGVTIPAANGIDGFVHDGCFRADDIGYGIEGRHYDLYTGTTAIWSVLEAVHATDSQTTLYSSPRRCAALQR